MDFRKLGVREDISITLEEYGYVEALPVQEKVIPEMLAGKDVIVKAKTAAGKTLCYVTSLVQSIDEKTKGVQALVVCPTRELALQVEKEFSKCTKYLDKIKVACLYGGQDIGKQISAIRGNTKIVIGTPGRILEHIRKKSLWLTKVKQIVLDEADEMLNMGFSEDIEKIIRNVPCEKHIHMFSATMGEKATLLAKKYIANPCEIYISEDSRETNANVREYAVEVKEKLKAEATARFLQLYKNKKAIVFCDTKKNVDMLAKELKERGLSVSPLHSDIVQSARIGIVENFREGKVQALVATDVAARGIDIQDLELVINYSIPYEEEYYVHRIGRTGRNGNIGIAITYYVGKEKAKLDKILEYTKSRVKNINIPRIEDIEGNNKTATKEITKVVAKKIEENIDAKVFVNVGKKDNVKAKDILGSLAANTAISKAEVGHIWVEEEYSIVKVPSKYVKEIEKCMLGKEVKGVKVTEVREEK